MTATHEDAMLIVQLLRWGSQIGFDAAHDKVMSDRFDPATASVDDSAVSTMLSFFEVVGAFVKQGVLDRGLVDDLWAFDLGWDRLGPAALRQREKFGEPRMYENFEALARQENGAPAGSR